MSNYTWNYCISHVNTIDSLTPYEKEKAKNALEYIKDLFDEDLTRLINEKHPITHHIAMNFAPLTRRWLVSLIESINALSNQTNGSKILNKIRDKDKFKEALLQLYIGKCLIDSGFSIEFLEEDNKSKTVDWKITDLKAGEQIFVELTEISKPPDWQKRLERALDQISTTVFNIILPSNNRPHLLYRGRFFKKYISKPVLAELLRKIKSTAEKARKKGFADLVEENTICLAFATEDNKHLLKSWSIEQKVINTEEEFEDFSTSVFRMPTFQINEVDRIFTRIEDKKGQLVKKSLNILIIRDDRVFYSRNFIPTYINYLEQFVYDHDYLSMLIIVGGSVRQRW
jgi:hypothetical protein